MLRAREIVIAYLKRGEPNSTKTLNNPDGSVKQERVYGPDGRALKDTDYNHGGVGHTFPYEHDWDWSNSVQPRGDAHTPTNTSKIKNSTAVRVSIGIIIYWIVSEVSRLFLPRNFIPIP